METTIKNIRALFVHLFTKTYKNNMTIMNEGKKQDKNSLSDSQSY